MVFVAILFFTSKNPAVIQVRWFGLYTMIAGFIAFLMRDKKKVYKSGDRVISLGEDLFERNRFRLIPNDPRETRGIEIKYNYKCSKESEQWRVDFFRNGKLYAISYGAKPEDLVPLAVRYIMRDEEFDFSWDGTMRNQWITKK